MKHSSPDIVDRPHTGVEQDQVVPNEPGGVIESHGEEHVLVDDDPGTIKRGEREEYDERKNECGKRDRKSSHCHSVYC